MLVFVEIVELLSNHEFLQKQDASERSRAMGSPEQDERTECGQGDSHRIGACLGSWHHLENTAVEDAEEDQGFL